MSADHPTRRRAIAIFAASAAGLLTGGPRAAAAYEWQGIAMGAQARIVFGGIEPDLARAAISVAVAEIERLERALSLFREDSDICRLNRDAVLHGPAGDLRAALKLALAMSRASGGLFDPTVQALWETHVDWFAADPDASLPPDVLIAGARRRVDWRRIRLAPDAIRLGEGQRITLNGLGQGYVTDRIAALLRARGLDHVLVDLGEQRALGPRADGGPWLIARGDSDRIALNEGALATSEGSGCILGAAGAAHHLFDPRSGRSAARWQRITVHHRSAAVADALSTALSAAAPHEIAEAIEGIPGAAVWATDKDGRETHWSSAPAGGARLIASGRGG
jgi:thiamine biosynthesis lipoprotein